MRPRPASKLPHGGKVILSAMNLFDRSFSPRFIAICSEPIHA
jgi:hypothetical protein